MSHRTIVVAVISVGMFVAGCSSSSASGASAAAKGAASPGVDGIRSERIALRSQDAGDVSRILRELFDVPKSRDVRAVLEEPSTNEIVVVGTDRGIAQVRRILAPALVMQDLERGVDVVP